MHEQCTPPAPSFQSAAQNFCNNQRSSPIITSMYAWGLQERRRYPTFNIASYAFRTSSGSVLFGDESKFIGLLMNEDRVESMENSLIVCTIGSMRVEECACCLGCCSLAAGAASNALPLASTVRCEKSVGCEEVEVIRWRGVVVLFGGVCW